MKIGFVGLGIVGTQMVKHLIKGGHTVVTYPRGAGLEEARAAGAQECADYAKIATQSDALTLIVFDDDQTRDILFNHGALAAMKPGSVLTIHVTGSPLLRKEIQEKAPAGVDVLDVTFSGGPAGAEAGTLTLMVGGEASALEKMRPIYQTYADQIFHVGELGDAQVIKLLNNLILAANMMNSVELLKAAENYGLDPNRVVEVIQTCSGASGALGIFRNQKASAVMEHARRYMEKDVKEAMSAAKDVGLDLSAFGETVDYYRPQ
jgi:3-hydroxyisobutyrate dehydrogenase